MAAADLRVVAACLRADLHDPQVLDHIAEAVGMDLNRVKIKAPKVGHDRAQ